MQYVYATREIIDIFFFFYIFKKLNLRYISIKMVNENTCSGKLVIYCGDIGLFKLPQTIVTAFREKYNKTLFDEYFTSDKEINIQLRTDKRIIELFETYPDPKFKVVDLNISPSDISYTTDLVCAHGCSVEECEVFIQKSTGIELLRSRTDTCFFQISAFR